MSRVSCRVSFSERFWRIQSFSDRSLVRRSEASLHLVAKLRGYDRPSPLSDGSIVGDNMSIFAATSEILGGAADAMNGFPEFPSGRVWWLKDVILKDF